MYIQDKQIYDEDLQVAFYLYKGAGDVYYVKHSEILSSNLLVNELTYLFVDEYCLLSSFLTELMKVNNYKAQAVVESILDRLCMCNG